MPQEKAEVNNVVFGPEIWAAQSNGGISRYIVELANNLNNHVSRNLSLIPKHSNSLVAEIEKPVQIRNLKRDLISISKSFASEKKIYHATYYDFHNLRIAKSLGYLNVITVHDMISEIYPGIPPRFRFVPNQKLKSVLYADGLICVSQSTKNDLMRIYGVPEKKIKVIHLASSFKMETLNDKQRVKKNNIIYVGKRSGYKNFSILLQAFCNSSFLRENYSLIAFGGGDFNSVEEEFISEFNLNEKVIQVNGDDSILRDLYLTSSLLVYPSLYEGFGLPPLEAMSLGCPVITSDVSSMPEVGAGAVLYFDPFNVQMLTTLLEQTLTSEKTLKRLSEMGVVRSREFSWQKTASETYDFYNKL